MKNLLLIVDMQNDFVDGKLANPMAKEIVPKICDYIRFNFTRIIPSENKDNKIVLTRDTHDENYLHTQEGKQLPIEHGIEGTAGWCVVDEIIDAVRKSGIDYEYVNKPTFGYMYWGDRLQHDTPETIYVCGTLTSMCVLSQVLILKATFPETKIVVLGGLCADLDEERHNAALNVMRACQCEVR